MNFRSHFFFRVLSALRGTNVGSAGSIRRASMSIGSRLAAIHATTCRRLAIRAMTRSHITWPRGSM